MRGKCGPLKLVAIKLKFKAIKTINLAQVGHRQITCLKKTDLSL